jgi:ABC-type lipoprotein release transport system permease subunit
VTVTALIALILAAVGVYAVMAYEVAARYELAVRFARGASPARLFRAVVGQSLVLGIAGTAIGVAVALLAARAVRSLLYGVDAADIRIFAAGTGLLLVVRARGLLAPGPPRRAGGSADVESEAVTLSSRPRSLSR